jgi:hypothetical protein
MFVVLGLQLTRSQQLPSTPEVRMRVAALSLLVAFTACTDDSGVGPGERITIETPSFVLQPGEEKFYCYHTTLPNAEPTGIHQMSSRMPPGSHHMIVYKMRTAKAPDGTLEECVDFGMGDGGLADIPIWLYAAQEPESDFTMPEGVGMAIGANQPVIVNMHYINQSDEPLTANVHVDLDAYAPGRKFTEAHSYITFNTEIDVAPGATGSAGGTCDVAPGSKFISMSTHSHKYTTSARVHDGDRMVLETRDWAHATLERWPAPHFTFESGKLDYRCEYTNTTNERLTTGESAIANEMCMAVGVFFPATGDTFCLNSFTITL